MPRRYLVASCSVHRIAPPLPPGVTVRRPSPADRAALAELMLDAYAGTIDADGDETIEMALDEIDGYFAGATGVPLPEHSKVAVAGETVVAVSLVSEWKGRPLAAYVDTATNWKGRGLASALLAASIESLWTAGFAELGLFVTSGNLPAERVYNRLGFREARPD